MKTLGILAFILLISTAVAILSPSLYGYGGTTGSSFHSYDGSVVYDEKDNKVIERFFK